jgi:hypothetical protein
LRTYAPSDSIFISSADNFILGTTSSLGTSSSIKNIILGDSIVIQSKLVNTLINGRAITDTASGTVFENNNISGDTLSVKNVKNSSVTGKDMTINGIDSCDIVGKGHKVSPPNAYMMNSRVTGNGVIRAYQDNAEYLSCGSNLDGNTSNFQNIRATCKARKIITSKENAVETVDLNFTEA